MLALPEDDREKIKEVVMGMIEDEIEQVVLFHTSSEIEKSWDVQEIYEVAHGIFHVAEENRKEIVSIRDREAGDKLKDAEARTHIILYLVELADKAYDALEEEVNGAIEKNMNTGSFHGIVRGMLLRSIDSLWVEHLDGIDHLRTGIGLRGYGQRDPLIEYKKEAFRMFNGLMASINKNVVYSVFKIRVAQSAAASLMERRGLSMSAPAKNSSNGAVAGGAVVSKVAEKKVGRNEPCPCGSGKKYKKCHGR